MPDTLTANYGLTKPEDGASNNTWGAKINADLDTIDGLIKTNADAIATKQAGDPTLTAFAGLAWVAGTQVVVLTAADTAALKTVGAAAGNILSKEAGDSLYFPVGGATGLTYAGGNNWNAVTQPGGDNSTLLATTAFVTTALAGLLASAVLTGVPTAPTAALNTATTQVATTAFVDRLRDVPRVTGGLVRGAVFATAAGFTVNAANAGEMYMAYNDSAAPITITQGTATLRLHGTASTGNRTLAGHGLCSFWYNAAGEAIVSGDVS